MIKIYRENNIVDHELPYDIYIDNVKFSNIYEKETKNINISNGKHKMMIKSSKFISNEIEFENVEDSILEFIVKPDYKDDIFSKFFTSTLYGKVGIKVEIKKEFYI